MISPMTCRYIHQLQNHNRKTKLSHFDSLSHFVMFNLNFLRVVSMKAVMDRSHHHYHQKGLDETKVIVITQCD